MMISRLLSNLLRANQSLIVLSWQELHTNNSKLWVLWRYDILPSKLAFNQETLDDVVSIFLQTEEIDVLLELILDDIPLTLIQALRNSQLYEVSILISMDEVICNLI